MTQEDFELIKKYDDKFESLAAGATRVKYATIAMQQDCAKVYQHLFGRAIAQGEWSCPHCAFRIYKEIAMVYVDYKKSLEKPADENKTVKKTRRNAKRKEVES